jgi:uncharacterized OB-fold protein
MTDQTNDQPEFAPFWEHLERGEIAFPRCLDCERHHWYPKALCPWCQSTRIEWTPVRGEAALYSWTVVRYAFTAEYQDKLPYTVALVEFPDAPGVRLLTNLSPDDATWRGGMALTPTIEAAVEGTHPKVVFSAA